MYENLRQIAHDLVELRGLYLAQRRWPFAATMRVHSRLFAVCFSPALALSAVEGPVLSVVEGVAAAFALAGFADRDEVLQSRRQFWAHSNHPRLP